MDELEISGKRYISSRRAAKENRYHVDYIGQLIRGGKVLGTKVGRAWYVSVDSLEAYLNGEREALNSSASTSAHADPLSSHASIENGVDTSSIEHDANKILVARDDQPAEATNVVHGASHATVRDFEVHAAPMQKVALTYVADEDSFLPNVSNRALHKPNLALPDDLAHMRAQARAPHRPASRAFVRALATIGVVAFVATFVASYTLRYDVSVSAGSEATSITLAR